MQTFDVIAAVVLVMPAVVGGVFLAARSRHRRASAALEERLRAELRRLAESPSREEEGEAAAASVLALLGAVVHPLDVARAGRMAIEEGLPEAGRLLTARARREAPQDRAVVLQVAEAFVADGMRESAVGLLEQASRALPADLEVHRRLAVHARLTGAEAIARRAYERALEIEFEVGLACEYARHLLRSESTGLEAAMRARDVMVQALAALRGRRERGETRSGKREWRDVEQEVDELYERAVQRAGPIEKGVEGRAAAGLLDGGAGVNYKLAGYAKLVDSDRAPRRLTVPSQEELARSKGSLEDEGLRLLRAGDPDAAVRAFRAAVEEDRDAWPALVGLGAAMRAARFEPASRLRSALRGARAPEGLARLVPSWRELTEFERGYLALCAAPLAWAIPSLLREGGAVHVVALDARITDLPEFRDARGETVQEHKDGRRYDAIGGMATGPHAAVRIEELYEVAPEDGWTAAHEIAHAVLNVADEEVRAENRALFERFSEAGYLGNSYALRNEDEFFACGYERFVMRRAYPGHGFDELHECDRRHGLDAFFERLSRRRGGG